MKFLIPDTILARTLLVLIVGLMLSHILSIALYLTDRESALLFTGGEHTGERIATLQRIVENAPAAERRALAALADSSKLHVSWNEFSTTEDQQDGGWQTNVLRDALTTHLGKGEGRAFKLRETVNSASEFWRRHMVLNHQGAELGEVMLVSLPLPDNSWLNFAASVRRPEQFWSLRFAVSMGVMLLAVGVLSALVTRHLTSPYGTFARAAQRLGTDVTAPPIPVSGPAEIRQTIQAFNKMQDRIRRFVEDRTQMLAAISHDLGTPVTRLRLRAELVEDEHEQQKMLADLDDMERMMAANLSFAREEFSNEPHAMVDLKSLLQRVCNDMKDSGHTVTLDIDDDPLPYGCRPTALRRGLVNIVDNAIKYGGQARVSVQRDQHAIRIRIDDDGPGIPDEFQEDAFKPYRRLEASRNNETGGTGLGLTLARTTVHAHGGDIKLINRSEGGLRVEIMLPR